MAVDAITAFSVKPLRLAFYIGCLSALLSLIYLIYIFRELLSGHTVEGWTSLMVVLLFLGASQLVTLGIIGEYIGRIYDQTRGRPRYVVKPVPAKIRSTEVRKNGWKATEPLPGDKMPASDN
jgi:dolichol-phosphate mannosyltransferase